MHERPPQSRSSRPYFAVVMGDIVNSEKNKSKAVLSRKFNAAVTAVNKKFQKSLASPLTITLGDEFQGLAIGTCEGFALLGELRLALLEKDIDCRLVLGSVKLDTKLNRMAAWNMMGDGLASARRTLNDKSNPNAYRFSLPYHTVYERLLNAAGLSLTIVEERWTSTQMKYFRMNQGVDSVSDTARKLDIAERTLYKVLEAARWRYYNEQHEAIAFALRALDRELGM
jgi:hypothetical protein